MYGLEAINANNGWDISVVGVTIVFSGLAMLSLVVSQFYKVLALWENPSKIKSLFKAKPSQDQSDELQGKEMVAQIGFTESQKEVAKQFALLIRTMEDHFSLPRLLHLAQISDLKNPHSNLNNLLKAKIIISDDSGFFTWEKETFDKAIL